MARLRAPVASRKTARPKPAAAALAGVRHVKRAAPSLGHAGNTVNEAVALGLKQLGTIESEIVQLTRRTVAASLAATGAAAKELSAVMRDVVSGSIRAAQHAGAEINVKAVAKGAIGGVHDARGNVVRAGKEIVKTAIKEADRLGAGIGAVTRGALDGIAEGAAEAGSAALVAESMALCALATAADIGALAVEAVRQVLAGSAAGLAEVARTHAAVAKRRSAASIRQRAA